MDQGSVLLFVGIGLTTGVVSGLFGIGGGLLLIPALMYLADTHSTKPRASVWLSFYRLSALERSLSTTAMGTLI